jgi:hypothetical protein
LIVQVLWCFACDSANDLRYGDAALPAGAVVTHYTGAQLAADPTLVAAFMAQGIADVRPLTGYAYSVITMPAAAFDGQLAFTARIRGRRCYDPALDNTAGGVGPQRLADPATWAYSDVPSVCWGDYLSNPIYGCGVTVDWSSVLVASQANRAIVPGSVEPRRRLGVSFTAPAAAKDISETLRAYSGCFLLPGANGVRMLPDSNGAPVASYRHTLGQIAAIDVLSMRDLNQAPTAVEVIYTDTSAIPWRDASAIASLDGAGTTKPWRISQVRMPGIHRYGQAMREAIERLNKLTLNDLSTTMEVFDEGIAHDEGDIIEVEHPIGLAMTPMRVTSVHMPSPGRWRLGIVRHSAAAYSNLIATAEAIQQASLIVPAPVGLGIKLNVIDFAGTLNWNEAYIHAVDANGIALDAPGFILINGVPTAVPNGNLYTNFGPVAGYIMFDTAGPTFPLLGGAAPRQYAFARRYLGRWQFDDNSAGAWTDFTPTATMHVIGTLESGAGDVGAPGAPPGLIAASMWAVAETPSAIQAGVDMAQADAAAAQADADAALARVAAIDSDGILSRGEKPQAILDWQALYDSMGGILDRADAFGITTERAGFVAAVNAHGSYLAALVPSWSDATQDTPIVAAAYRASWSAAYTTRQALMNRIAEEAGKRANWGQVDNRPSDDSIRNNLIDVSWWRQDAAIPWGLNGEYNRIINTAPAGGADLNVPGPRGGNDTVWYCSESTGDGGAGGGWNGPPLSLNPARAYRFVVPIRRLNGAATAYWGTYNVCELNTSTPNGNPYFAATGGLSLDRWYLFVGYIFPAGSIGNSHESAGVWDCKTGAKVADGANWCFAAGGGSVTHRAYQYYSSAFANQVFGRPMVNVVDGTEPSLREYFEAGAVLNSALLPVISAAQAAAEAYALAKANLAEATARAYADGIVDVEEARAIADAQAKANAAQAAAIATAQADATAKSNAAQSAAQAYAVAQANAADVAARAYADGLIDVEEARAIADATAKADAARAAAEAAAAADATAKANVAALTAQWTGVTGRPYDYDQDATPSGAVTEGSTWRVPATGRVYRYLGGTWKAIVGAGSVGTDQLAGGTATDVLTTTAVDVDIFSAAGSSVVAMSLSYGATHDCEVLVSSSGVIDQICSVAQWSTFAEIISSTSGGFTPASANVRARNVTASDAFAHGSLSLTRRFFQAAGTTVAYVLVGNSGGFPRTGSQAGCACWFRNMQMRLEAVKR